MKEIGFKNKYGNRAGPLLTDTDILMHKIQTEDVCEDFSKDKEMFDFSNYSPKSKFYNSHVLVLGKMVDETAGLPIKEFVRLKSKMYFFLVDGSSKHKNLEHVNQNVAKISRQIQRCFNEQKMFETFDE